jgi:hypothetical protein
MKGRIRNGRKAVNPPEYQRRVLLSLDRATAIKNWFQTWADEKGIDGWTLLVDGKGETELRRRIPMSKGPSSKTQER